MLPRATLYRVLIAILFSFALLFFLERGAYRGLHESLTGDFATVYSAARCWLHHENPYDRTDLRRELVQAGAPQGVVRGQDQHASLYPISAMAVMAAVALLPWTVANVTWCVLSLACFAASVLALLKDLRLSTRAKWVTASICLLFSPTYVGVVNGNPSVISISLTILCLHLAIHRRLWSSCILFGIALCIKPQIAICGFLALLLWKCWRPLIVGAVIAGIVSLIAVLQASSFGQHWEWFALLQQNLTNESAPGGLADSRASSPFASGFLNSQTLSYLLTNNPHVAEGMVLIVLVGLIALYFYFSEPDNAPEQKWIDVSFFAAITLAIAYHRYYDAQLLLVLIPAVVYFWQHGRIRVASILGLCFVLMAFPLQSAVEKRLGPDRSLLELVSLRYESFIVLLLCVILTFSAIPPTSISSSWLSSSSQRH